MCDPKLLLLDEPFHGLDVHGRSAFIQVIDDLIGSEYCTIIFVSHHGDEIPSALTHELSLLPSDIGSVGSVKRLID